MRITSFEFAFIKSFRSLRFDLSKTSVLIGQNDHGKSSILKAFQIVLNQLDEEAIARGALHPDMAERLLPIFPVKAKARRITINYDVNGSNKQLLVTVRKDLTFTVMEEVKQGGKTTPAAIDVLKKLRQYNKFTLIPALRDASSKEFADLFSDLLREHGLAKMIPQGRGGTPKEYRTLKGIRDKIAQSIKPYIDAELLPKLEQHFGFETQHKLALKFDMDVERIGQWILDNLRLGFQLTSDENVTLALSEAGSGVQSSVLLALHRLKQKAKENPGIQYILALEEPEAFLHPQKQKELYQDIRSIRLDNLKLLVTTHSPYIVSETPFTELGLVKRDGEHSALHVADVKSGNEQEMFDTYSNDINSALFFAEKVVLVEGESDLRVIRRILEMKYGPKAHRVSVISASGNQNFSPYLRMIRAWQSAKIPHLVVTDFDSLLKSTDRAIIVGARAGGYSLTGEAAFHNKVDSALDKGEAEFEAIAVEATTFFKNAGLNVFVFTSDLENALVTSENRDAAASILNDVQKNNVDYKKGYDIMALKRLIGSKGVPLNPMDKAPFKLPFVHRKIASTIDFENCHKDITRLLSAIDSL